jgi:hypothetical protein
MAIDMWGSTRELVELACCQEDNWCVGIRRVPVQREQVCKKCLPGFIVVLEGAVVRVECNELQTDFT